MSTREVADLLGIPRSTVYELARRGDLPARRLGGAGCSCATGTGGNPESESDDHLVWGRSCVCLYHS
jgi:excisionase family DNA binding protein